MSPSCWFYLGTDTEKHALVVSHSHTSNTGVCLSHLVPQSAAVRHNSAYADQGAASSMSGNNISISRDAYSSPGNTPEHPTLPEHLLSVAEKMAHRMRVRGNWLGRNYYTGSPNRNVDTVNRLLARSGEILDFPTDWCESIPNFNMPFEVEIPERTHYEDFPLLHLVETPKTPRCFTDGSKNETCTGAGFVIRGREISEDTSIPFGKHPSVYQTELTAISRLRERLLQLETTEHTITIYSDSLTFLKAL